MGRADVLDSGESSNVIGQGPLDPRCDMLATTMAQCLGPTMDACRAHSKGGRGQGRVAAWPGVLAMAAPLCSLGCVGARGQVSDVGHAAFT